MNNKLKIAVVGAGPVGSLAALYAAQRGHDVEVYELRPDLRDPSTVPLNFTKSINLALSERGITALRHAGDAKILENVLKGSIPLRGRMIHGRNRDGKLYEAPQDYDIHGRTIFAIDRAGLNKTLLDALEELPNVRLFFNHKLTGADYRNCQAWFEVREPNERHSPGTRAREIQVEFDLMIGADGAHSSVRYHMMKFTRMNYSQDYVDTLWCEFQIKPKGVAPSQGFVPSRFAISPNHLHIWPGKDFMFIAIASEDGSFTCTLFMPEEQFRRLEHSPGLLPGFFNRHFPGVTDLIPASDLIDSFETNPHLPLINIKCRPYHFGGSAVIVGDAAHAMVPFYGQGMNTGLESVRILFSMLDKHMETMEDNSPSTSVGAQAATTHQVSLALSEYSTFRAADAHAINDLALQNYVEMRASVLSPTYRLRKWLEEAASVYFPSLGWQTKYSRVSFGNERFSDVVAKSEHQGKVLTWGLASAVSVPVIMAAMLYWGRPGRPGRGAAVGGGLWTTVSTALGNIL